MADEDSNPKQIDNNDSQDDGLDPNSSQDSNAKDEDVNLDNKSEDTTEPEPKQDLSKDKPKDTDVKDDKNEVVEEVADPLDNLFDDNDGKTNLKGKEHFEKAADKKFKELSEGLKTGDEKAIAEFKSLKPKLQKAVTDKFSKIANIDGEVITSPKQLLKLWGEDKPVNDSKPSASESKAVKENVVLRMEKQFSEKSASEGLDAESLVEHKKEVVKLAKEKMEVMKRDGISLDKFNDYFDFDSAFLKATSEIQKRESYSDGLEKGKKIAKSVDSSPKNNSKLEKPGTVVSVDKKVSRNDYYNNMSDEARKTYRQKYQSAIGSIAFTDS